MSTTSKVLKYFGLYIICLGFLALMMLAMWATQALLTEGLR